MLASTKGTTGHTPGWSMHDISCETSQTVPFFCAPRPLLSYGETVRQGIREKRGGDMVKGRTDRGRRESERDRRREDDSEPCGCYLVMHGSVIATIQPAYKRGSVSIPLGDLRFIAPRWIADSQILRFALINDSY